MQQEAQGQKWWLDLVWRLFDGAMTNAWILWNEVHKDDGKQKTRIQFVTDVQTKMVNNTEGEASETRAARRHRALSASQLSDKRFDSADQFP